MYYPKPMDFEMIVDAIQKDADECGLIYIVSQEKHSIEIVDDCYNMEQTITFTDPLIMDEKWFADHIWIHPSVKGIDKKAIIRCFSKLDRNIFICLRHVLVVQEYSDIEDYVLECVPRDKQGEFLDMLPAVDDDDDDDNDDDNNNNDPVGVFWHCACVPIVFMGNIIKAVDQLCDDTCFCKHSELCFGFWTTLLHEIGHLMHANPYLPEDDYPEYENIEEEEEEVEKWALKTFESLNI